MLISAVIWFVLSLVGTLYAASEWSETKKDLKALGPNANGAGVITRQLLRNARWLTLSLLTFFLTSMPALLIRALEFSSPTEATVRAYLVTSLLIAGLAFLVLAVADQRRSRFEGLRAAASKLDKVVDAQRRDLEISERIDRRLDEDDRPREHRTDGES